MDRKGCEGTGSQGAVLTNLRYTEGGSPSFFVCSSCINDTFRELDNREIDFSMHVL